MHIWIGGLLLQIPVFLMFGLVGALPGIAAIVMANALFAFAYAEMGRAVRVFAGGDARTDALELAADCAAHRGCRSCSATSGPIRACGSCCGAPVLAALSLGVARSCCARGPLARARLSHRRPVRHQRAADAAARGGRARAVVDRCRHGARVRAQPVFPDRLGPAADRHDRFSADVQRSHQRRAVAAGDARSADRRVQPPHVRRARQGRHRRGRARSASRCRCSRSTSITSSTSTTSSATKAATRRFGSSSR